jgi:hypothetical protein
VCAVFTYHAACLVPLFVGRYVLNKDTVSSHERNILARYRSIHFITDQMHSTTMERLGWHPIEFARGHRMRCVCVCVCVCVFLVNLHLLGQSC